MANPVTTVFNTPELLEHILLYLDSGGLPDWKTLLQVPRISRTFQSTIAGSKRLQRALFVVSGYRMSQAVGLLERWIRGMPGYASFALVSNYYKPLNVIVQFDLHLSTQRLPSSEIRRRWQKGSWSKMVIRPEDRYGRLSLSCQFDRLNGNRSNGRAWHSLRRNGAENLGVTFDRLLRLLK